MALVFLQVSGPGAGQRDDHLQRGAENMSASLCQVDTRQFSARIEELHDALIGKGRAGDAATVFEDEARKFLETVIKVTPPKNRAQGNQAVKDDMYNIFTPVAEDFLNDIGIKYGVSGINGRTRGRC